MTKRRFACGNCGRTFSSSTETNFLGAKNGEYWYTTQGYVAKCPVCGSYAREISQEEMGKCAKAVNILGTEYTITVKKYDEDKQFTDEGAGAYCTGATHEIVCCDLSSHPEFKLETEAAIAQWQKRHLRHEIVHAFFEESGLSDNSMQVNVGWARMEEMVDWIAIQGPKIYKAWEEAGCL